MKIILNHNEIVEAVRAQVLAELPLLANHELKIYLETEGDNYDVNAVVAIMPIEAVKEEKEETVKTTRAKKTTAPVKSTETDQAPWVEPVAVQEKEMDEAANEWVGKAENPEAEQVVPAPRIFPDMSNSQPAPATEPVQANGAAKSLFANLTKPVHDAPRA